MPVSSLWMFSWYGPMSTRLTSAVATDALNRSSRDELEGRIMGKTAQEGVAAHSSARKQIDRGHVHDLPPTLLHGLPCQGDWQGTSYESDWSNHDATSCTCT